MTQTPQTAGPTLRDQILARPDAVLDDPDLLSALIAAEDARRGGNVVDLRGLALSRLETRLEALEATHSSVLSAAYDNVATTQQVHRAMATMIAPLEMEPFLRCFATDVADILRVASVRIMLEPSESRPLPAIPDPLGMILPVQPGIVEAYVNTWRGGRSPDVVLRRVDATAPMVHRSTEPVASEALIRLQLGRDIPAGLLVLGATDPDQYHPAHATDLISLFGRVFERVFLSLLP